MIRIRKESFGYVLFERDTRRHDFVATGEVVEEMEPGAVQQWVSKHLPGADVHDGFELVHPPPNALPLAAPLAIYMEITSKCNMACAHCYKPLEPRVAPLTLDELKALVQELHAVGVFEVRLCGNEPTASPHFLELGRFIKEVGLHLSVNTNGFFDEHLRVAICEQLRPGFVVVSLDGDEPTHDRLRRRGAYGHALRTLEALARHGIERRINMCISVETLPFIDHVAEVAARLGAGVSFFPLRTMGRETQYKATASLEPSIMRSAVERIERARARYPAARFETFFDVLGTSEARHHTMHFNAPCPPRKNGFISYFGDFHPCDFIRFLGDRWRCGNVRDGGFWAIWARSERLREFQSLRHSKCEGCEHFLKRCYGGCWCSYEPQRAEGAPIEDRLCFLAAERAQAGPGERPSCASGTSCDGGSCPPA